MTKIWQAVPEDVYAFALKSGLAGRVGLDGSSPFRVYEILATDDEVSGLYDWLTAACEHISCPTI